jgi:hypothetical protein
MEPGGSQHHRYLASDAGSSCDGEGRAISNRSRQSGDGWTCSSGHVGGREGLDTIFGGVEAGLTLLLLEGTEVAVIVE